MTNTPLLTINSKVGGHKRPGLSDDFNIFAFQVFFECLFNSSDKFFNIYCVIY